MSFSLPHRYKLYIVSYWSADQDNYHSDVMMSSMPSREEILQALRNCDQLEGYADEYIDGLKIHRPDGWYYKKILIYSYSSDNPFWKFIPAP